MLPILQTPPLIRSSVELKAARWFIAHGVPAPLGSLVFVRLFGLSPRRLCLRGATKDTLVSAFWATPGTLFPASCGVVTGLTVSIRSSSPPQTLALEFTDDQGHTKLITTKRLAGSVYFINCATRRPGMSSASPPKLLVTTSSHQPWRGAFEDVLRGKVRFYRKVKSAQIGVAFDSP